VNRSLSTPTPLHRLDAEETRAIGLWIEASPERVDRVAIARALLQAAPQRGLRTQQISCGLAAEACLLVAAMLYLVNTRVLHHEQRDTRLSAANTPPSQDQTPSPAAANVTIKPDVVLITAERTRGEQKAATYQVHRESPVQLQVLLPDQTTHSRYQLRLAPATDPNNILRQQDDLEMQYMAGQPYLTVTLPPGSLPPATYIVSISGHGDTLILAFTLKWVHE